MKLYYNFFCYNAVQLAHCIYFLAIVVIDVVKVEVVVAVDVVKGIIVVVPIPTVREVKRKNN